MTEETLATHKRVPPPAPKGNKYALGNKGGRPTKYDRAYCADIIQFFDVEPGRNKFPMFETWCYKIGIHRDTMDAWVKKHPEFSDAYKTAKELQKVNLIHGGLSGVYKENFSKFVAVNCTDLRDKQEVENTVVVRRELTAEERAIVDRLKEGLLKGVGALEHKP